MNYKLTAFLVLNISMAGLFSLAYNHSIYYTKKEMRHATMIDTSASHGKHSYHTRGLFRDKETGAIFGDSIGDRLYRDFEKGGNQPIEVSWKYSREKRDQHSYGAFGFLACLTIVIGYGFLWWAGIEQFLKYRKANKNAI